MTERGFFAMGIYRPKHEVNVGSLWRTAHLYGAAFVFTVGRRYSAQSSDTVKTPHSTPLFHFSTVDDLVEHLPWSTPLVAAELDPRAVSLPRFTHPMRAAYILGAEDAGIPQDELDKCHMLVQIPSVMPQSMNVANAGSIIAYDRYIKPMAPRPFQGQLLGAR